MIPIDDNFSAGCQAISSQPPTQERIRRATLYHPYLRRTVFVRNFKVYPCMRVHPLKLDHFALKPNRSIPVKLGTKSMSLEQTILANGRRVCEIKAVMVAFDRDSREPLLVPDNWVLGG